MNLGRTRRVYSSAHSKQQYAFRHVLLVAIILKECSFKAKWRPQLWRLAWTPAAVTPANSLFSFLFNANVMQLYSCSRLHRGAGPDTRVQPDVGSVVMPVTVFIESETLRREATQQLMSTPCGWCVGFAGGKLSTSIQWKTSMCCSAAVSLQLLLRAPLHQQQKSFVDLAKLAKLTKQISQDAKHMSTNWRAVPGWNSGDPVFQCCKTEDVRWFIFLNSRKCICWNKIIFF